MDGNDMANKIARQLYAMVSKKRDANLVTSLRDERYQRTFTDDYPWKKTRAPRELQRVSPEQKAEWAALMAYREGKPNERHEVFRQDGGDDGGGSGP